LVVSWVCLHMQVHDATACAHVASNLDVLPLQLCFPAALLTWDKLVMCLWSAECQHNLIISYNIFSSMAQSYEAQAVS
jgi:hypothetical protein